MRAAISSLPCGHSWAVSGDKELWDACMLVTVSASGTLLAAPCRCQYPYQKAHLDIVILSQLLVRGRGVNVLEVLLAGGHGGSLQNMSLQEYSCA